MNRLGFATSVAVTVLTTLVLAATAYGAMANELRHVAAVRSPLQSPSPFVAGKPTPAPSPIASPTAAAASALSRQAQLT